MHSRRKTAPTGYYYFLQAVEKACHIVRGSKGKGLFSHKASWCLPPACYVVRFG
jgi:hypothetical protein